MTKRTVTAEFHTDGEMVEASRVTVGAQTGANFPIIKDGDRREKNDLVQAFTSVDSNHNHGIRLYVDNGLELYTTFNKTRPNEESHDHQLMQTPDGNYVTNVVADANESQHFHTVDGDQLRSYLSSLLPQTQAKALLENLPVADSSQVSISNVKSNSKESHMTPDEIAKMKEDNEKMKAQIAASEAQKAKDKIISSFDENTKSLL